MIYVPLDRAPDHSISYISYSPVCSGKIRALGDPDPHTLLFGEIPLCVLANSYKS